MKYVVIRAYGPWSVGHVFTDMPGNVARTLMARGLVREADEQKQMASPVDRMMRPVETRRAGRPLRNQTA